MSKRRKGSVFAFRGQWRARVTMEGRKVDLGSFRTEQEADDVLASFLEQAAEVKRPVALDLVTYGAEWLDRRERDGVRAVRQERSVWRARIATADFAKWPLRRIRTKHVNVWLQRLAVSEAMSVQNTKTGTVRKGLGRTLSRQSVKHALRILRQCLQSALSEGKARENAAEHAMMPRMQGRTGDEWTFLEDHEIRLVVEPSTIPESYRLAYAVAILTGLRKGELRALQWGDVTLTGDRPRITVQRSNEHDLTKSGRIREVPLMADAVAALSRIEEMHPGIGKALVWPARHGSMRNKSYVWQWGNHGVKAVGRHVRFHDLRHTCASHLLMGTWTKRPLRLEEVKVWMGHSTIAVTERYAHLSSEGIHALARPAIPTADEDES